MTDMVSKCFLKSIQLLFPLLDTMPRSRVRGGRGGGRSNASGAGAARVFCPDPIGCSPVLAHLGAEWPTNNDNSKLLLTYRCYPHRAEPARSEPEPTAAKRGGTAAVSLAAAAEQQYAS